MQLFFLSYEFIPTFWKNRNFELFLKSLYFLVNFLETCQHTLVMSFFN